MLFYIDAILNVMDKYNETRDSINHITLDDFIEALEDINDEEEILRQIEEIKRRC